MDDIKKFLNQKIDWQKSKKSDYLFIANIDGCLLKLRLNDFPEEPLCTLIWESGQQDLEDLGKNWTLPKD